MQQCDPRSCREDLAAGKALARSVDDGKMALSVLKRGQPNELTSWK